MAINNLSIFVGILLISFSSASVCNSVSHPYCPTLRSFVVTSFEVAYLPTPTENYFLPILQGSFRSDRTVSTLVYYYSRSGLDNDWQECDYDWGNATYVTGQAAQFGTWVYLDASNTGNYTAILNILDEYENFVFCYEFFLTVE